MSILGKKCVWAKMIPLKKMLCLVVVIETVPVCLKHVTALQQVSDILGNLGIYK